MSDTREAILKAAHALYLREGLAGLSMRKVAKGAKISAPAIYRHFQDKETMLFELVAKATHIFMTYLSRGLSGEDARERLLLAGMGYMDFALEHSGYYRIMFMAPKEHVGFQKLAEQAASDFAPTFQFLVDRVRECMASGELATDDAEKISAIIWANCHGLCSLRLADHFEMISEATFREMYQHSIEHLLVGLS